MASQSILSASLRDLRNWPERKPPLLVPEQHRERYLSICSAIEMRIEGASGAEILDKTGVGDRNLCRILNNAKKMNPATGKMVGFDAAIHGFRVDSSYQLKVEAGNTELTQDCTAVFPPNGPGICGYTFRRFPHIHKAIDDLFLKRHFTCASGKVAVRDAQFLLHELLREEYRRINVDPETHWPFNTDDQGLETLRRYRKKLLETNPERYIWATYGEQAALNLRKGTGMYPVEYLEKMPPLSVRELDFHTFSGVMNLHMLDPNGCDMVLPLDRIHVGIMVDRSPGAVHGFTVVFEATPDLDSVLETIDSCINAPLVDADGDEVTMSLFPKGNVTISSIVPALNRSGFALLLMDNALSNISTEVASNVMDVIGCAVQFGIPHRWWVRPHVERFNDIFERRTGLRLPSTLGSHHKDTNRADDPAAVAKALDIRAEDVVATLGEFCRTHNTSHSGTATRGQTIQHIVETLIGDPASGVFVRPLPLSSFPDWSLFAHAELVTVRGNPATGIRPYIQTAQCKYRSPVLAKRWDLLGKKVRNRQEWCTRVTLA